MTRWRTRGIWASLPYLRRAPQGEGWLVFTGGVGRRVFLHPGVVADVLRWARDADPLETIGPLGGRLCLDPDGPYTIVVAAVPAEGARRARAHVVADAASMQGARERLLDHHPTCEVVGWWHTHPGYGAFFSGPDRGTQATYDDPGLVGLVVDPRRAGLAGLAIYLGPDSTPTVPRPRCLPVREVVTAVIEEEDDLSDVPLLGAT